MLTILITIYVLHLIPSLFFNGQDPVVPFDHPVRQKWVEQWMKSKVLGIIPLKCYLGIRWWLRNPFHDFTHHILGVYSRRHWVINIIPNSEQTLQQGRLTFCFRTTGILPIPCIGYQGDRLKFYWGMINRGALIIIPRITWR